MFNTGLFYLLEIDAKVGEQGIEVVRSIRVRCNACERVTRLSGGELGTVPGGTILTCHGCLSRQALSNARLIECERTMLAQEVTAPTLADGSPSQQPGAQ